MTQTVEVTKEVATEFHRMHGEISELIRQRDELARLVKEHNDKMWNGCLSTRCNDNCETVGDCPMQYMIDLPEWAK